MDAGCPRDARWSARQFSPWHNETSQRSRPPAACPLWAGPGVFLLVRLPTGGIPGLAGTA